MTTCFICGNYADSEEHVIPKWLQTKYDLWNQRLTLPNRTTITYKQLTIPCCTDCNTKTLSQLESRVKSGEATDEELWKWSAKIHFGLLRKDDFLEWDRKNPGYQIGQVLKRDDPLELERHLAHSIRGDFKTYPNPFGSVFRFSFNEEVEYNFVHLIAPVGLCVSFGNVGYVVFVRDTGSLNRQPSVNEAYLKHSVNCHPGKMLNFFANAWVHLYRHRVSHSFLMTPNSIAITGAGKLVETVDFTDEQFRELWSHITSNQNAVVVTNEEYETTNGIVLTPA